MGKWLAGIVAAVLSGVLIYYFTEGLPWPRTIPTPEPTSDPAPEPTSDPKSESDTISGTYLMDNQRNRIIIITYLESVGDRNRYRIEEASSPWPWEGIATLEGENLTGIGDFIDSQASMKVEGIVRSDDAIMVKYTFIKDSEGNDPGGRVDNHVWFPQN
ncbi:MAG: hypothetical protein AAGF01_00650 [Cyanobacteria bacterium P01_G01_bin.38]